MNYKLDVFNHDFDASMTILKIKLKSWCRDYVKDEKEEKWLFNCYENAYFYHSSAKLNYYRMKMQPNKPVDSILAAAFGNAVGGTALGLVSYLEAEKKKGVYSELKKVQNKAVSTYAENMGCAIALYNEIIKKLSEYPEWVKNQEELKQVSIEKDKLEKKEGNIFVLIALIISMIISIPFSFLIHSIINNIGYGLYSNGTIMTFTVIMTIFVIMIIFAIIGICNTNKWYKFFRRKPVYEYSYGNCTIKRIF